MEQRVRAAHKDGFRTSKILKYESQNLNFPLEMGFDLQRKRLSSLAFIALDFIVIAMIRGWLQLYFHIVHLM